MKARNELCYDLIKYKTRAEDKLHERGYRILNITLDLDEENLTSEIKYSYNKEGIKLELASQKAPQSSGAAERRIQEHWSRTRVLPFAAKLPNSLWQEAINHRN